MKNAFSIDLEDWFCVNNLKEVIDYSSWDTKELRVVPNTRKLLSILDTHNVKCTVFVLGWIAERVPELIREIDEAGHEIATHGYAHLFVKEITPDIFEKDLKESLKMIRAAVDTEIRGYRAPSFSVKVEQKGIFDILARNGIRYDSSVFPIAFHPDYGNSLSCLSPFKVTEEIIEFPMGCFRQFGVNLPCCGGGYFRLLPYRFIAHGIRQCNKEGRPVVFYIHPWELDPGQPRVKLPAIKTFRHYYNLEKTEVRLNRLLSQFEFDTIRSVYGI
ncbi:MAG: DUF3473 domain-containing protein [Chitinivibrionales bacterium]|nr:DUF3473 domain-containing protein [Chitinivibrionales bacterium]